MASADRAALLVLYRWTDGPNWRDKTNWDSSAALSDWKGVKVNYEGRVVELRLRDNNLQGSIPEALGALSELMVLDLSNNRLAGPVPKKLVHLRKLQRFFHEGNRFSGSIPDELVGQLMLHGYLPRQVPMLRVQRWGPIQAPAGSLGGGERPSRRPAVSEGSGIADDSIPHIVAEEEADDLQDGTPSQVTLANSLGPEPAVYVSPSHGVELQTQAGSISDNTAHGPVTVSPCLQVVECPAEGSGRGAPVLEDDVKEEFLITTVIDGPDEVSFLKEKPAKLRFFVGYVDDFTSEHGSDLVGNDDIKKHVLETYRPLTSPDGKGNWTNMQPLSVLFPPSVHGKRAVWVETALYHFSVKALGMKIGRNTLKIGKSLVGMNTKRSYIFKDFFPPPIKKLRDGDSRKRMVSFGNRTEYHAIFVYYPTVTFTKVATKSGAEFRLGMAGVEVGAGTHKESAVEGHEHAVAMEPILVTVKPGGFSTHELHAGLKDHTQLDIVIGVLKDKEKDNPDKAAKLQLLDVMKISGRKRLVLLKQRLREPLTYPAIDWECTSREILEAIHPIARPMEETLNVATPPVETGPMPPLEQTSWFRRFVPAAAGIAVGLALAPVVGTTAALVGGVGMVAAVMPDDENDD